MGNEIAEAQGRSKMCTKFYLGNVTVMDSEHRLEVNIEMNLKHICLSMWTVFMCLKIGSSGELCEHGTEPLSLAGQAPIISFSKALFR
jgi:hypothetical protein